MKKILIGITLFTTLFIVSCSKDENVAKDYTYTFDEEFLDNVRDWEVDNSKPEKYTFNQLTGDNGLFNISYFSSFGNDIPTYSDYKPGGFDTNGSFILETTLTWVPSEGDYISKSDKYCGLSWDVIDDKNYSKIGVALNPNTLEAKYKVIKVVNGKSTELVASDSVTIMNTTPPVYTLKVEKNNTEFIFMINNVIVGVSDAVGLSTSNIGIHADKDNVVNFHNLYASEE